MWPISRTRGPSAWPSNVPTTVSPSRPAGSGRPRPSRRARRGTPRPSRPTSSTPVGRVAPAVDVDEALEVGEVGRQVGARWRRAAPSSSAVDGERRRRRSMRSSARSLALGRLLSCPDRAPGRDPPARRSQRLPARAGGQGRGRHRPAPDLVRPARPGPPRAGPPRGRGPAARLARRGRPRSPRWLRRLRPSTARGAAALRVHRSSIPGTGS